MKLFILAVSLLLSGCAGVSATTHVQSTGTPCEEAARAGKETVLREHDPSGFRDGAFVGGCVSLGIISGIVYLAAGSPDYNDKPVPPKMIPSTLDADERRCFQFAYIDERKEMDQRAALKGGMIGTAISVAAITSIITLIYLHDRGGKI